MARAVKRAPTRAPRPALILFGADAAEVVDDVPHVGVGQLALVALHLELRGGAVADDRENLAVARAAVPLGVGQVGRMGSLRRHRAVALGVSAVAEAAILGERGFAGSDRFRARRNGVLHFGGLGVALRGSQRGPREHERRNQGERYATHQWLGSLS